MPRFEIALRTRLRFHTRGSFAPAVDDFPQPETVAIDFQGRTFVWHALPSGEPLEEGQPPREFGPSLTVVVEGREDEREAAESLQRLLSALAFHYETEIEAVSYGGSGETDPMHAAVTRAPRAYESAFVTPAPERVAVDPDPRLRLALAVYREGLNTGTPFYGFLAFWNVLEAVFHPDAAKRNAFIRDMAPQHLSFTRTVSRIVPIPSGDLAHYFRDEARNAVAHIKREDPADTSIDPDLPEDRERLSRDAGWMSALAKQAIYEEWPDPVQITMEQP